jgi:hypothetical protein
MPYTSDQLNTYYRSVNNIPAGTPTDQATALQFQALAQQNANGTLSDAAVLRFALNSAQTLATTDVALATYQFYTGAVPNVGGINYLDNNPGTGFNTAYYNGTGSANGGAASATNVGANGFDTENRYYNQSIALALDTTAGASFRANYGGLTLSQTIQVAYETIIGQSNVTPSNYQAAIAAITQAIPYFTTVALRQARTLDGAGTTAGQNIALKATIVGYILEEGLKADVGTYASAIDQFNASTAAGNNLDPATGAGVNVLQVYAPGGAGYGTGVGTSSSNSGGVNGGSSTGTPLTPNVETVSGSTFNGGLFFNAPSGTYLQTLNTGDVLNGSSGTTNTLNVTFAEAAAQVIVPTLNNIATVNIVELGTAGGTTLNLVNSSAVKNINVSSATTGVTVSNNAGALTSLSVANTGANTVTVGSTAVAVAGTTDTIAVTLGSNVVGAVTAGGYEIVNLTSSGANNAANNLNVANFVDPNLVTLNLFGSTAISLTGITTSAVTGGSTTITTINAGGTAAVPASGTTAAVAAVPGVSAVTIGAFAGGIAFNSTTNSLNTTVAGVTAIPTPTAAQGLGASNLTFTGSAGNDTLILAQGLNALDTLNGNGGSDTLGVVAADNPGAALNVTNFQTVTFYVPTAATPTAGGGVATTTLFGASATIDRSFFGTAASTINLGSGTSDTQSAATGSTLTVKSLISGNTVGFDYDAGTQTTGASLVTGATAGTPGSLTVTLGTDTAADIVNLNLRDTDTATTFGSTATMALLTATGVETLNLNLIGGAGVVNGVTAPTFLAQQNNDTLAITGISDAALTTLKITGAANLTLGSITGSLVTPALINLASIDASAATGNISLGTGQTATPAGGVVAPVAFQTVNTGATILTGAGNDLISIDLGLTGNLKTITMGSDYQTAIAGNVSTTSVATPTDLGDTLVLTSAVASLTGNTVIDLSSTADQVLQVLGSANSAAQTGIENIDLSGLAVVAANTATITGSAGANYIVATAQADTINAGAGNDIVTGGGGADNINVGTGVDTIRFVLATDSFLTGSGNTQISTTAAAGGATVSTIGMDIDTGIVKGDRADFTPVQTAGSDPAAGTVVTAASPTPGVSTAFGILDTAAGPSDALFRGTYTAATNTFVFGAAGPDLLYEHDTNGATAAGVVEVVLVGSAAAGVTTVTTTANGMHVFG